MTNFFWIGLFLLSGRVSPVERTFGGSSNGERLPGGPAVLPRIPAGDPDQGDQGIEGVVYPVSGNRMPSPDRKPGGSAAGSGRDGSGDNTAGGVLPKGVKSTVYVFELTNISQVTRQGQSSYYPVINTKLVKQADTDDSGYFKIALPPGRYSLFTRKGDLFYASRRDEKNNLAPVEVAVGKFTRIDCKIEGERKAVY